MIDISHQQARRLLRTHLDTQLPNEQWTMLQTHLETCAECRAYSEQMNGLEKSLRRGLRTGLENTPGPESNITGQTLTYLRNRAKARKVMLAASTVALFFAVFLLLGGPAGIRARLAASQGNSQTGNSIPVTQITVPANASAATPIATAAPGQFPDVVAYESRRDGKPNGDSEIYLLNPGNQPVDISNSSAQDTDPAWSPDGEWLAFLSDRNKKTEIFVTSITGSRMIQVTSEPGIHWQGPLSWSPDGKWIALSGNREQQGDQSWIYLAALDGSGVRALAGSRGGESPKFAPLGDEIAYTFADGTHEGITITHLKTGKQVTARWNENPLVSPPATGSSFDWSLDGAGLAFVSADLNPLADAAQPQIDEQTFLSDPGSQVLAVRDLNDSLTAFTNLAHNLQIASSRWPGAYRAVTWTPGGGIAYLEDLEDARAHDKPNALPQGCWTVQIALTTFRGQSNSQLENSSPASFGGLCVVGGLQRASWTPDGRWVVVQGRLPSESQYSVFALRMPGRYERGFFPGRQTTTPFPGGGGSNGAGAAQTPASSGRNNGFTNDPIPPGTILRLVNDPWASVLPMPRPRLSQFAAHISIDPQPANSPKTSSPKTNQAPSNLSQRPGGPQGEILYTIQNNAMSVVVSANPDGAAGRVLLATPAENYCPTWSPDKRWIALAQSQPDAEPPDSPFDPGSPADSAPNTPGDGIYTLESNGTNLSEISQSINIPGISIQEAGQASYGCPVWSPQDAPGGPYVAALVNIRQKWFLALLPAGDSTNQPRYISLGQYSKITSPVWSANGRSIYLLRSASSAASPGMRVISVPEDPHAALTDIELTDIWQSPVVPTLAIAPDGKSLVELEMVGAASQAHLHSISLAGGAVPAPVGEPAYLKPFDPQPDQQIESGSLTWLHGSTFGVILHGGPADIYKSLFYLYDLDTNTVWPLAMFGDRVNSVTWSTDGRWLVFSSESGLWGLDIAGAIQRQAAPVWLSPQPVQYLDWK
jgi:Tol biopolymer transport system component